MMTHQKFHTGQDKSYNVRLMRAARRVVRPKRTTAYVAPVKMVWRREVKRVKAARGSAPRIRLFVGIAAGIMAFDAAIAALVFLLRRFAKREMKMVEGEAVTTETRTTPEDAMIGIEEREPVLV